MSHGKTVAMDRIRTIMNEIEAREQPEVGEYEELHRIWAQDPCGMGELYRRQREAKQRFSRSDVADYVNMRVVDDGNHVILDRIIKNYADVEQAFEAQASYGMTYTLEMVTTLFAEITKKGRIDRQMREFIDRCGGALNRYVSGMVSVAR